MKSIVLVILLGAILSKGSAQELAVQFYGSETNENTFGIPYYWPKVIQNYSGTNVPIKLAPMTQATLDDCITTNRPAYVAWQSNKFLEASIKLDADLADFFAKMDKLNVWIDRTSGTNSLSNAQRDSAINDICQTFKKLRRALVNLYKPE